MTTPREIHPEVDIVLSRVMSNHHTIIFDRHGTLPVFTEHLHKRRFGTQPRFGRAAVLSGSSGRCG